jgi:hypothetical protein
MSHIYQTIYGTIYRCGCLLETWHKLVVNVWNISKIALILMETQSGKVCQTLPFLNNRYLLCWHTSVIHGWKAVEKADFWVYSVLGTGNFVFM